MRVLRIFTQLDSQFTLCNISIMILINKWEEEEEEKIPSMKWGEKKLGGNTTNSVFDQRI